MLHIRNFSVAPAWLFFLSSLGRERIPTTLKTSPGLCSQNRQIQSLSTRVYKSNTIKTKTKATFHRDHKKLAISPLIVFTR